MRRFLWIVALALAGFGVFTALPASAIYLSEDGTTAKLYGPIVYGDEKQFAEFLAKPRAAPLRTLYLDSYGGSIDAGIAIARMVRKARMTTAVDAAYNRCVSSCTLIFAGGILRHNVHGEQIEEGYGSLSGLGYHTASLKGDGKFFSLSSEKGTQMMASLYAEMGCPAAASLLPKGRGSSIYRPSGSNSLAMKIATSLAAP